MMNLSFAEWLYQTYGKCWQEVMHTESLEQVIKYAFDYEFYCHAKGIETIWQ